MMQARSTQTGQANEKTYDAGKGFEKVKMRSEKKGY